MSPWDEVADAYQKAFRPRFKPVYEEFARIVQENKCEYVLDFATGVGEPAHTILAASKSFGSLKHLVGADGSQAMLRHASQVDVPEGIKFETFNVENDDQVARFDQLDAIVSSFGIMYNDDVSHLLQVFKKCLQSKQGILACSIWPHPSTVPFLRIWKQVSAQMSHDAVSEEDLENRDPSFRFWRESDIKELISKAGFEFLEWREVDMPTHYDCVDDLLLFSEFEPWYHNHDQRARAITIAKQLLSKELKQDVSFFDNNSFDLSNKAVIIIACSK